MVMVIAVFVLIGLAIFGGGVGLWIGLMGGLIGLVISLIQPALSRARRADNQQAAAETSTRPGPGCPCAECQEALWTATGGADNEWVVMDSPRDGRKTTRLPQNLNGHPRGCSCLDCGDLRAGKSSRWA